MKIHLLLSMFLVMCQSTIWAQSATVSPYSIYGIGDESFGGTAAHAGMSYIQAPLLSPLQINTGNPSSYAQIKKPTFGIDLNNDILTLDNGNSTQTKNAAYIRNIVAAFPIIVDPKKRRLIGMSFGAQSLSKSGYSILSTETIEDLGEVQYQFDGTGGLSNAHLGIGFELINDSNSKNILSLGANWNYVFGTIKRERYTVFDQDALASNLGRNDEIEISSWDFRLGAFYSRKLYQDPEDRNQFKVLTFGAYFQPSRKLNGTFTSSTYTFLNPPTQQLPLDTLDFGSNREGITSPTKIGFGTGFYLNNKWTFALEGNQTRWSELEIGGNAENLQDAFRVAFAAEYIPDYTAFKKLLQVVRYRGGIFYGTSRLSVQNTQLTQYGINFGLGVPMIASRSSSMFNIAMEYSRRGATGVTLNEEYLKLIFGFTFTPNQYDRWFYKRKYD